VAEVEFLIFHVFRHVFRLLLDIFADEVFASDGENRELQLRFRRFLVVSDILFCRSVCYINVSQVSI
jgi:hypothetical protein